MPNLAHYQRLLSGFPDAGGGFARFRTPASDGKLAELCAATGRATPPMLEDLLRQTDGIENWMRLPTGEDLHVGWSVWPVAQLIEANRHGCAQPYRFAPAGVDGIVFALDGECVVAEYAIDPRTIVVAGSLEEFLRRWSRGELSV